MKSAILYESVPSVRGGVSRDGARVFLAYDFSTTAFMMEELIGLGHTCIVIRRSLPEAQLIDNMPPPLRRFVRILDDAPEREAVSRILEPLRRETGVILHQDGTFEWPFELNPTVRRNVVQVHHDLLRLTLGFNHQVQVGIELASLLATLRDLRRQVRDGTARAVLAVLQGVLQQYERVEFEGARPRACTPSETLSTFRALLNDTSYLQLSEGVQLLSSPNRRQALARISSSSRSLVERPLVAKVWDYATKVVRIFTGVPLPEAATILALTSSKSLPLLLDMQQARREAIRHWVDLGPPAPFVADEGAADDSICWLPPHQASTPIPEGAIGFPLNMAQLNALTDAAKDRFSDSKE